jgi:poly-beta-1,6-N-acetyl-D-glucosamine N-deacetylase
MAQRLRTTKRFSRFIATGLASLMVLNGAVGARAQVPLPQVSPHGRTPYLAIIVWHDVEPVKQVWFDTSLADFREELAAIARGGFHVITLEQLRDHLEKGAPVASRPLMLTFDDNAAGIYRYAFPELRKYGFHATLFVHTNYVGRTTSKIHNSWPQLKEMERSGLVTVQSMTANHPEDLRQLSDSEIVHEYTLSRFSIERRLGHGTYAIAYPYDNYDDRVERLAAANGYELGFTEDWGNAGDSSSLLAVHRYSALTRFQQALDDVTRGRS